ncbi:MAG: hypothetical protein KAT11_01075 [Phycisphaerae bacterium]|nr:hypothetical protein [Phycisphaerae bacterium]
MTKVNAGFAEVDITPKLGTLKGGWWTYLPAKEIVDPLFARAAVFEGHEVCVGFIQLDVLSIRWSTVNEIRRGIEAQTGVSGKNIMVSATHNHAGPGLYKAVLVNPEHNDWGEKYRLYPRDEQLIESIVRKCTQAFCKAWAGRQEALLGYGHGFEFRVAHNRRIVMRDGTVQTHGSFKDPNALYFEGPVDPEVAILAAKTPEGRLLGCLLDYTVHPTHHGDNYVISAGYPGVISRLLKERGYGTCLYLNGASGNVHTMDHRTQVDTTMEQAGTFLADTATKVLDSMTWSENWPLSSEARTLQLPYRRITDEEICGKAFGAQRFIDSKMYDFANPELVARIRQRKVQPAEIQAIHIGDVSFVGVPAEYFVEYGLQLKLAASPRRAYVVGHANGMIGYVPTREAFRRGGYETTFGPPSRMAPEVGDIILDAAIELACHQAPQGR